jgi:oligoribonuclease NrnB/cAMP/cGMP phosphodiesterase (DHH superfamily)
MKIKLFTHTDLDGTGCAVVANVAFGKDNVSVEYCDYQEINKKVMSFINGEGYKKYDRIFITDISVDEETASEIDKLFNKGVGFQLVDHHATALWLSEKYPMWCEIRVKESNLYPDLEPEREKVESSGTTLFYKFLRNKNIPRINANPKLKAFAEVIRKYDTWNWNTIYKDDHPKKLNDLLYIIGREKFVERFSKDPIPEFNETESTILEIEEHRINKYIWYKKKGVKTINWNVGGKAYNVAYVFAEQNVSLLGNEIAQELKDEVDFVAIVDMNSSKVSLRGVHDHINLGTQVAYYYGGGGHPKASGFEFSEGLKVKTFMDIISKEEGINDGRKNN